ncbi:MAG: hypothetical protein WCI53_00165 [Bacteroidota bacterium]|jgi:hypothetical protein
MVLNNSKCIIYLIFLISSCYTPKYIKDNFNSNKYCYYPQKKVNESIIRSNGYYQFKEIYERYESNSIANGGKHKTDSQYINIVFYKDGIFINDYYTDCKCGSWGKYFIDNDIIKTIVMYEPWSMTSYFRETWFKLINKDSIVFLSLKSDGNMTTEDVNQYQLRTNKRNIIFNKFVPNDSIPDANKSWIKQKKWFWCNKKEYKLWKAKN